MWLSLYLYISASCMLVVFCIVGQRHYNDNNKKMNGRLTWSSKKVKSFMDIRADVGHHTERVKFVKLREGLWTLCPSMLRRQQYIKVWGYTGHNDKWYFSTCCQAEHIKAICSGCWVSCVLTVKVPLQGLIAMELRAHLPGDLDSAVVAFCYCCVHICPNELTQRENGHWFQNTSNQSRCESILKNPLHEQLNNPTSHSEIHSV